MNKDEQSEASETSITGSSIKNESSSLVNKEDMDKRKDQPGYGSVSEAGVELGKTTSLNKNTNEFKQSQKNSEEVTKNSCEDNQRGNLQQEFSRASKNLKSNPGFVNMYFDSGSENCPSDDNEGSDKSKKKVSDGQNAVDESQNNQTGSTNQPPGLNTTSQESQNKLTIPQFDDGKDKLSVSENSRDFSPYPLPGDTLPLLLDDSSNESSFRVIGEIIVPFLLAGLGCVFAGIILDLVKSWAVFLEISEVFILVPALLGLKGNLEMTLASRLSTQANLGNMDSRTEQWKMIYGNLALTQVQAIIVGLLASIFAIMLGWIPSGKFNVMHGFLMCAGSVLTAVLATLLLGSLMVGVVLFSRRFHINPDNVATPIAASLGDLTTISLLSIICQFLFTSLETQKWLTPTLLSLLLLLIPLWWYVSHKNKYTNEVLYSGWVPVIGAMVISSFGGLVLDYAVVNFNGLAIFQPVINGVGGNLVAVQASRLSTALHRVSSPGNLPENAPHGCPNPITTFFSDTNGSRTARVLMLMVVPGHMIFMLVIYLMQQTGDFVFTIPFAVIYLVASVIQVALLLYIANGLVHLLWARGNDPDNSSIPYLTAIGDLLGTSLLALTFLIVSKMEPTVKH